eukprot:TRINITY_DN12027_c0_g1_i1.p1 TRINITY_DN12027_c0_g1~~TRINITY_DN12027_c0_g1_i1.p1  ORF type:complete len:212 (-),score=53.47 TRINITY_DN12027_c0_g1_i1:60-695(-)
MDESSSSDDDFVVRFVLVGEEGCGKTSLLHTYLNNEFPEGQYSSASSKIDKTRRKVEQDGTWSLQFEDTRNNQQEDRNRLLSYPFSDIVFICYDVSSKESLASVSEKWLVEINHHCHNKPPCFLVGLKSDLSSVVSASDVSAAQSSCAKGYTLSAKTDSAKVTELFNDAITAAIAQKKKVVEGEKPDKSSAGKKGGSSGGGGAKRRGCVLF